MNNLIQVYLSNALQKIVLKVSLLKICILKNILIRMFIKHYEIDMTDYPRKSCHQYKHFNDFFTREILPDKRPIDKSENALISPADGKIIGIDQVNDSEIGESANRISIFLSVFNVHVNRVPMTCTVKQVKYIPGKFLAAYDHKASDENEKTEILFSEANITYRVHQIAGIIARRIRCYAEKDLKMVKGDRLGFIMFGSRTDIIFPKSVQIEVDLGDKVKGGETIIGKMI